MFCKYCGTQLIDEAAFCHECGKSTYEQPNYAPPAPPVQPVYQQPAPQPVQPVYQQPVPPTQPVQPVYQQPVPQPMQPVYQQPVPPQYTYTVPATPVQPAPQAATYAPDLAKLEQQILSCGIWGLCLSMLGVPGIILSVIANKKANEYKRLTGSLSNKAQVGYRLCKAGKAVSIVMTVILFFAINALEGLDFDSINPFEDNIF